ncbi:MAG: N-acetyltransferase [Gammaproteobacteria bacterium]|nr:N-acetyltransferase [Gammaproteobacteria bacterium]MCP5458382.1 N-acetyltransferase [Gammaproteobacteria bacterium]
MSFSDEMILADGQRLRLRPVIPEDRERFVAGFEHLSPESRFQRFHGPKLALTPRELDFYTHCDGHDHLAIAAVTLNDGEEGHVVGVARGVRLPQEHDMAEVSLAVIDDLQRHGVGYALMRALMMEAANQRIRWLRAHVFADNIAVRNLLDRIAGDQQMRREQELEIEVDFPNPYSSKQQRTDHPRPIHTQRFENLAVN